MSRVGESDISIVTQWWVVMHMHWEGVVMV
jgi:hypothetical protein